MGCGGGKRCEPDDGPSDGAMYAAHSRSLLTPEQNATLDADFERIIKSVIRERRIERAYEIVAAVFGALCAAAVVSIVLGKLLGVI